MEKKDSIFSSLMPASQAAPIQAAPFAAAPLPAARPAVADQDIYALKQKIEAMEKNIVSQLEKKIAEARSVPQPPMPPMQPMQSIQPMPPSMSPQFLLTKIAELDKKLEMFTSSAMLSAAQMKNVEESKISTRREIEDLLKVVREQQKYSEMDRQMHDQVEKSWHRVEELEKKLMDFYSSAMHKSAEEGRVSPPLRSEEVERIVDARFQKFLADVDLRFRAVTEVMRKSDEDSRLAPPLRADEVGKVVDARFQKFLAEVDQRFRAVTEGMLRADEVGKVVDGRFQKFLENVDQRFRAVTDKLDGQFPAVMRKNEEKISAAISELDAKQAAFATEFRKLSPAIFAGEESVRALYAGVRSDMLFALKESLREEHTAITSHIDSFILDIEERMDSMSKLVLSHADGLTVQAGEAAAQLKKIEAEAGINAQKARLDLAALGGKIEEALRKNADETGERIQAESAKSADKIMEFSRLSSYSLSGAASLAGSLGELSGRLETLKDRIQGFADGFKSVKLESLLGVSGALVRRNYEGLQIALKEMAQELAFFKAQETEITGNLKAMAGHSKEKDS
jgi:hypothetical protein